MTAIVSVLFQPLHTLSHLIFGETLQNRTNRPKEEWRSQENLPKVRQVLRDDS